MADYGYALVLVAPVVAHDHIAKHSARDQKQKKKLKSSTFFGIELMDTVTRLHAMNLLVHVIGAPLQGGADGRQISALSPLGRLHIVAMAAREAPDGFRLNTSRRGASRASIPMLHLKMNIKHHTAALAALLFAGLPLASSSAYVAVSVGIAPPAIPVYEQPFCPAPGYIWTPGYWAYADFGYYWVPGVWVAPPRVGLLWTPGYWGYNGGRYVFNDGYWGPTVGFYGGINYGFGYVGHGYYGGEWVGDTFRYNTAVTRVNTTMIHNTYVNKEVANNNTGSRASFNGPGGAEAKASAQEQAAAKAEHVPPTPEQRSRAEAAKNNPDLHAANNHGKPKREAIEALDHNNGREPAAAAAAGHARAEKQAGAEKAKGGAAQAANGNSAFGHRQGDATTRTRGSQNNAYGKAQSADAHGSHPAAKAARTEEAAAPHARKAAQTKPTAPRAARQAHVTPHRPQAAPARRAAPEATGRAPARAAQPGKKKKKPANEEPGSGR